MWWASISPPDARGGASSALMDLTRPPQFLQLDAQSGDLGHAVYDAAFSRFGVMFFSDPLVAFSNIRHALKPQGRLGFVCWRPLQENIWMLAPLNAALPFLPVPPPADPRAPGPFAFADAPVWLHFAGREFRAGDNRALRHSDWQW